MTIITCSSVYTLQFCSLQMWSRSSRVTACHNLLIFFCHLQCKFDNSAATGVPACQNDSLSDQCLSEIFDHTNLSCNLARLMRHAILQWPGICYQNFSRPTQSALTYFVSKDVDCWLQVHNRQFDMTSDRQWWDDHSEQLWNLFESPRVVPKLLVCQGLAHG